MKIQYIGILLSLLFISCGQDKEESSSHHIPDETTYLNWRIAHTNHIELKNLKYLQTTLQHEEELKVVNEDLRVLEQFDARIQDIVDQPSGNEDLEEVYLELKKFREGLPDRYRSSGYPQFSASYSRIQESQNNLIYEILELERQVITFVSSQMLALLLQKLDKGVFPIIHSEPIDGNNDSIKHTIIIAREIGREPTILEVNGDSLNMNQDWQNRSVMTLFSKRDEVETLLIKVPAMTSKEGATLFEIEMDKWINH